MGEKCDEVGVEGFPTIKYGDPDALEDYEGGRELEDLQQFAKDSLGPRCSPSNLELCDADKKKEVEKYMQMSVADLTKLIEEKDEEAAAADKEFEETLEKLQAEYEKAEKQRDEKKKAIKEAGLGLAKSVKAF